MTELWPKQVVDEIYGEGEFDKFAGMKITNLLSTIVSVKKEGQKKLQ